jgi:hypothetical protein
MLSHVHWAVHSFSISILVIRAFMHRDCCFEVCKGSGSVKGERVHSRQAFGVLAWGWETSGMEAYFRTFLYKTAAG